MSQQLSDDASTVRDPAGVCSLGSWETTDLLSPPRQTGLTCVHGSIWQIRADTWPRDALTEHIVSRHLKHFVLVV